MNIFRDVTITWGGVAYTVTPSLRLMRLIEQGDVSFADIATRTANGRPPISHIAYVIARMLQSAGKAVSEDDVYVELMTGDQDAIGELISAVLVAFAPMEPDGKNPDAQTATQKRQRAKAK